MKIWNYSAILATTATAAQVADIQSAYLTHATPETRAKDTSLHGCNCKFLNDASYTAGPVYNGSNVDWLCRGWRLARGCVLGQDLICGANADPEYEFSGDCNAISGGDEVCQKALCNLDRHFAQELHTLANNAEWSAATIYTDVDNPGECALLGNKRSTTNRCCISATGVYTYLQQNHASDFESLCTLPIDTYVPIDSTETLVHSASTTYTADPADGWRHSSFPNVLSSFEQDGIIYHGGNNYMEGFFANNGSVAKTYRRAFSTSADVGGTDEIWPFEYQGTNYIVSSHAQSVRKIYIYKRDEPDTPVNLFDFEYAARVKAHGDKILACGRPRCCLASIPTLLAVEFRSNIQFSDHSIRCFEKDPSSRSIQDAEFDDNYVWTWEYEKLRKFDINTGNVLFDSTDNTNQQRQLFADYWDQKNTGANRMMIHDGKLFIVAYAGTRIRQGPLENRPYLPPSINGIRDANVAASYYRGNVLIVNPDDSVYGYYRHEYPIPAFKISKGLFMFTDSRFRYVDQDVIEDRNARKEVGSLFIFNMEDFMLAAASFEIHQGQDYYDTSSFLLHEIEGHKLGKATTMEMSGDSVFVMGEFRYFGDEIRRFTFSN